MTRELWSQITENLTAPAYHLGTYRSMSPSKTLKRIKPLLLKVGVTRLADITGLDTIGIPVYQSIRPNSRNISVSNGKGLTNTQAKVSALMESIEGFHAEEIHQESIIETVGSLKTQLRYDPYSLPIVRATARDVRRADEFDPYLPPIGTPAFLNDHSKIPWIRATDLLNGDLTWVPRQLCELNFCVEERICVPFFRATSNGLASGNTISEAIVHGLSEVVERDSVARLPDAWKNSKQVVDAATVDDAPCRRVIRRFHDAGFQLRIVDITGPTGLPCFESYVADDANVAHKGFGCHPSRETALLRALTEAAQSRLSHIAGTRDDLYRETYRNQPFMPAQYSSPVFSVEARGSFLDCPNCPVGSWSETLADMVTRVRKVTGMSPLAVDLTRPELGIPVVMVVAPGLSLETPRRR